MLHFELPELRKPWRTLTINGPSIVKFSLPTASSVYGPTGQACMGCVPILAEKLYSLPPHIWPCSWKWGQSTQLSQCTKSALPSLTAAPRSLIQSLIKVSLQELKVVCKVFTRLVLSQDLWSQCCVCDRLPQHSLAQGGVEDLTSICIIKIDTLSLDKIHQQDSQAGVQKMVRSGGSIGSHHA